MAQQGITRKDVIRYVALPGIRPRFKELVGRGFFYIPYFIALVFECARLLPKHHPYLNARNIGLFGIRHVIAEAANNLVLSRNNLDQIIIFGLMLTAIIIVVMQVFLLLTVMFIGPVMAGAFPVSFAEFFVPGAYGGVGRDQDIALILLDMVFGVPGVFGSCADLTTPNPCEDGYGNPILMADTVAGLVAAEVGGGPATQRPFWDFSRAAYLPADAIHPFHAGLHQMFAVYSYGLLLIAVFITVYFMFVVVAETAQTGTAFGKRFNKVWAPIRIVVAFGLLVPISFGMNSGQFIVLYAAYYGSGFASNGWAYFNSSLATHYYDGVQELVSVPNYPEVGVLAQFFYTAATCKSAYMLKKRYTDTRGDVNGGDGDRPHIVAYLVRAHTDPTSNYQALTDPGGDPPAPGAITAVAGDAYDQIVGEGQWLNGANRLILRFGNRDTVGYGEYLGSIKPLCGEIVMNFDDPRAPATAEDGPETIQRFYWFLIKYLWFSEGMLDVAGAGVRFHESHVVDMIDGIDQNSPGLTGTYTQPTAAFRSGVIARINGMFYDMLEVNGGDDPASPGVGAIEAQRASASWNLAGSPLLEKGWAGAAIWYNRIAEMNGAVTSAIFNIPMPSRYPDLMEHTKDKKMQYDQETDPSLRFNPRLPDGNLVDYPAEGDSDLAQAMYDAYSFWTRGGVATSTETEPTGNVFIDSINTVLGTYGLYDMRKNTDVHPLAQLVGVGRALVESSIRNLGYAAFGSTTGGLLKTLANFVGPLAGTASSFLITTAMIGLTAGFILYYIIPFLPFIYFFFAVGGWVKGIFEAMVGVPLWALAHIRIDGNGLPGQAAINGYFLIFEIFLRPILIIFGFLASILIFAAMVQVLNEIFDLVVGNLGGFDMNEEINDTGGTGISYQNFFRSAIDEFFFTLIYAIVVYMMGQSSFKLIDQIPNNILRWMNQNVATFNDQREDPAQGLVGTAQIGAQQGLSSLGGGLQKMSDAATR